MKLGGGGFAFCFVGSSTSRKPHGV
jgi:hypothetical protein